MGWRVLRLLGSTWSVRVLTRSVERFDALRAAGAVPLHGDLDDPHTLGRLAGLADAVLHLAPPPGQGPADPRTAALPVVIISAHALREHEQQALQVGDAFLRKPLRFPEFQETIRRLAGRA